MRSSFTYVINENFSKILLKNFENQISLMQEVFLEMSVNDYQNDPLLQSAINLFVHNMMTEDSAINISEKILLALDGSEISLKDIYLLRSFLVKVASLEISENFSKNASDVFNSMMLTLLEDNFTPFQLIDLVLKKAASVQSFSFISSRLNELVDSESKIIDLCAHFLKVPGALREICREAKKIKENESIVSLICEQHLLNSKDFLDRIFSLEFYIDSIKDQAELLSYIKSIDESTFSQDQIECYVSLLDKIQKGHDLFFTSLLEKIPKHNLQENNGNLLRIALNFFAEHNSFSNKDIVDNSLVQFLKKYQIALEKIISIPSVNGKSTILVDLIPKIANSSHKNSLLKDLIKSSVCLDKKYKNELYLAFSQAVEFSKNQEQLDELYIHLLSTFDAIDANQEVHLFQHAFENVSKIHHLQIFNYLSKNGNKLSASIICSFFPFTIDLEIKNNIDKSSLQRLLIKVCKTGELTEKQAALKIIFEHFSKDIDPHNALLEVLEAAYDSLDENELKFCEDYVYPKLTKLSKSKIKYIQNLVFQKIKNNSDFHSFSLARHLLAVKNNIGLSNETIISSFLTDPNIKKDPAYKIYLARFFADQITQDQERQNLEKILINAFKDISFEVYLANADTFLNTNDKSALLSLNKILFQRHASELMATILFCSTAEESITNLMLFQEMSSLYFGYEDPATSNESQIKLIQKLKVLKILQNFILQESKKGALEPECKERLMWLLSLHFVIDRKILESFLSNNTEISSLEASLFDEWKFGESCDNLTVYLNVCLAFKNNAAFSNLLNAFYVCYKNNFFSVYAYRFEMPKFILQYLKFGFETFRMPNMYDRYIISILIVNFINIDKIDDDLFSNMFDVFAKFATNVNQSFFESSDLTDVKFGLMLYKFFDFLSAKDFAKLSPESFPKSLGLLIWYFEKNLSNRAVLKKFYKFLIKGLKEFSSNSKMEEIFSYLLSSTAKKDSSIKLNTYLENSHEMKCFCKVFHFAVPVVYFNMCELNQNLHLFSDEQMEDLFILTSNGLYKLDAFFCKISKRSFDLIDVPAELLDAHDFTMIKSVVPFYFKIAEIAQASNDYKNILRAQRILCGLLIGLDRQKYNLQQRYLNFDFDNFVMHATSLAQKIHDQLHHALSLPFDRSQIDDLEILYLFRDCIFGLKELSKDGHKINDQILSCLIRKLISLQISCTPTKYEDILYIIRNGMRIYKDCFPENDKKEFFQRIIEFVPQEIILDVMTSKKALAEELEEYR